MHFDYYHLFQGKDGGGKLFSAKPDSLELLPNKKKAKFCRRITQTQAHIPGHVIVPAKDGAGFQKLNLNHLISIRKVIFNFFHSFFLFPCHFPLPSAFTDNFLSITSKQLIRGKK